jgi:hypothetical protein
LCGIQVSKNAVRRVENNALQLDGCAATHNISIETLDLGILLVGPPIVAEVAHGLGEEDVVHLSNDLGIQWRNACKADESLGSKLRKCGSLHRVMGCQLWR